VKAVAIDHVRLGMQVAGEAVLAHEGEEIHALEVGDVAAEA
jgi:hypothetical protein